jgi:hypothetical protein
LQLTGIVALTSSVYVLVEDEGEVQFDELWIDTNLLMPVYFCATSGDIAHIYTRGKCKG